MEKEIKLNKGQRELIINMCKKAEKEIDGFLKEQVVIIRKKIEEVNN